MPIEPAELENFLNSADLRGIIGKNAGKFREKWRDRLKKHRQKGRSDPLSPWCMGYIWWLLLTHPFWFVYRKLYRYSAIWLGCYVFSCLLDELSLVLGVVFMVVVNTVYFLLASGWYAENCLAQWREGQEFADAKDRESFYQTSGGVDVLSTAAALVVWLLWGVYSVYSALESLGVFSEGGLMVV